MNKYDKLFLKDKIKNDLLSETERDEDTFNFLFMNRLKNNRATRNGYRQPSTPVTKRISFLLKQKYGL